MERAYRGAAAPLAEAMRLVESGEIIDAKTVLLLQKAYLITA